MPIFEVYDDKKPRRIQSDLDRIVIGRVGDIVIDDRVASRKHCEVHKSAVGFIVRDLGSRNGTKLNLTTIDRPVSLCDGDEIEIGKATVRFWADPSKSDPNLPLLVLNAENQGRAARTASADTQHALRPVSAMPPDAVQLEIPSEPEQPAKPKRGILSRKKAPPDAQRSAQAAPQKKRAAPVLSHLDREMDATIPAAPSIPRPVDPGRLTVDDIVPLNHEGKPANAIDPETGQVSESMVVLRQVLLRAFQFRATDIHIEPKEDKHQLRYRIDGTLHSLGSVEKRLVRSIYTIVRLLCNLDINSRDVMQDGSFDVRLPDRRAQLRVSIAPSITGHKMVLRVLDTTLAPTGLDALNMEPYILREVRHKTAQNSSMIVVCGPTGSGKTTTVYAILNEMDALTRNIVTVEQPVEYKLENIIQIEVSPDRARGEIIEFSSALRSLLRQDPDVILVGEIRDADTARTAVQASMTGHLMLTTVHARDSIGCVFRLLDLGVEPFLLASALSAVLSQRLMRSLCPKCKSTCRPAISDLSSLGLDDLAGRDLYTAVGCDDCLNIGYKGRIPIFEFLAVNDQVRDAIANRPTIQQLRQAAGDWIFQTLREDGVRKLRNGLTSLEEFHRVAYQDG